MGAGASAEDKAELQRSYAAWEIASAPGQPPLGDEAFLMLLKSTAPNLHAKASAAPAAAASIRSQFETARRKLQIRALEQASSAAAPPGDVPEPPALQKIYSWAPNKETNLARGLAAGMISSEPLRLIDLVIADVSVVALVDTGAEHCAISSKGAERCGLKPLVDESFAGMVGGVGTAAKQGRVHYAKVAFKAAGSGPSAAKGGEAPAKKPDVVAPAAKETTSSAATKPEVTTPTDVQKEKQEADEKQQQQQNLLASLAPLFEVAFDVMSWPPNVNFECIIGIDFLARYRAKIDVFANTLQLIAASGENVCAKLRKDGEQP